MKFGIYGTMGESDVIPVGVSKHTSLMWKAPCVGRNVFSLTRDVRIHAYT